MLGNMVIAMRGFWEKFAYRLYVKSIEKKLE